MFVESLPASAPLCTLHSRDTNACILQQSHLHGNQRPQLTVLSTADFRERSKFIMEDGKWLYQGGDVNFDPQVACLSHSRRMA